MSRYRVKTHKLKYPKLDDLPSSSSLDMRLRSKVQPPLNVYNQIEVNMVERSYYCQKYAVLILRHDDPGTIKLGQAPFTR
jgi:hypothetical protein